MPLPWLLKAFDVNGAPLAGLTPIWTEYRHAETGAAVAQPDFEELADGSYRAVRASALHCGTVDLGVTAFPRWVHLACQKPQTFAAFDADGAPLADLSPTWASFLNALHLDDSPSAPAIDCLAAGSAIYAIQEQDPPLLCVGTIDLGATALPQYIDVTTNSARSLIANFDPAVGSTLAVSDLITCDVTDDSGDFIKILIIARFPDGTSEVVYIGPTDTGDISDITAHASGEDPTITATGSPTGDFHVWIAILVGGGRSTGGFHYSLDNGSTWIETTITIPESGDYTLGSTGITIHFLDEYYISSDAYEFTTAAGIPGGFEPFYAVRSTVAAITDGFHFEIGRQSGWPAPPTLLPLLLDTEGQETP